MVHRGRLRGPSKRLKVCWRACLTFSTCPRLTRREGTRETGRIPALARTFSPESERTKLAIVPSLASLARTRLNGVRGTQRSCSVLDIRCHLGRLGPIWATYAASGGLPRFRPRRRVIHLCAEFGAKITSAGGAPAVDPITQFRKELTAGRTARRRSTSKIV